LKNSALLGLLPIYVQYLVAFQRPISFVAAFVHVSSKRLISIKTWLILASRLNVSDRNRRAAILFFIKIISLKNIKI
jgi:hypothetical protein